MKSKKFFILALAAAVLFAFAACQAGSVSYSDINTISVAQTGTILVGQEPTAAAFTITGDFNGTEKVVQGKITPNEDNTVTATVDVLTFGTVRQLTATTSYATTPIESIDFAVENPAYVFAIDKIADIKTELASLKSADITINESIDGKDIDTTVYTAIKAGIVVDGKNVFDSETDNNAVMDVLKNTDNFGTAYPVVLQITSGSTTMDVETNLTVTIVAEEPTPAFSYFEFVRTNEPWYGDAPTWRIDKIDENGDVEGSISSDSFKANFQITNNTVIPDTYGDNEVTVEAINVNGINKGKTVKLVFPKGQDYITAQPAVTANQGATFTEGAELSKESFSCSATWKVDGVKNYADWDLFYTDGYTIVKGEQTVYFNVTWTDKGVEKTEKVGVEITGVAAE